MDWFFRETPCDSNNVSVAIWIFNPNNVIKSMFLLNQDKFRSLPPFMEIVLENPDKEEIVFLRGLVKWDGKTCPIEPKQVLKDLFGDPGRFFNFWFFNQVWEYDDKIMCKHGLSYVLFETKIVGQSAPVNRLLIQSGDTWLRGKEIKEPLLTIQDFVQSNPVYIMKLNAFLRSNTVGI